MRFSRGHVDTEGRDLTQLAGTPLQSRTIPAARSCRTIDLRCELWRRGRMVVQPELGSPIRKLRRGRIPAGALHVCVRL